MRFEPPIEHARLVEAVQDACGIVVLAIEFLPVGFGACYRLRTSRERYFLKVRPEAPLGGSVAEAQLASSR